MFFFSWIIQFCTTCEVYVSSIVQILKFMLIVPVIFILYFLFDKCNLYTRVKYFTSKNSLNRAQTKTL